jgi:hypothetical protein
MKPSATEIHESIQRQMYEFYGKNAKDPDSLLVGSTELKTMKAHFYYLIAVGARQDRQTLFCGLRVYESYDFSGVHVFRKDPA